MKRADLVATSIYAGLAAVLLRGAFHGETIPGVRTGEAWGRLFATAQVERWVRGEARWGRADLLAWPEGAPFWPIDPVLQAISVPLRLLLGDLPALLAVTFGLVTLAGLGTWWLARTLGARPVPAGVAGVLVQFAPFQLRNLQDMVLEVVAIGLLAGAAAACVAAVREPGRRSLGIAGVSIAVLAGVSPYFAVYLALGCGVVALATPRRLGAWARLAAVGALACGLLIAPLILLEGGAQGRLGPAYQGRGYTSSPGELVMADGGSWRGEGVASLGPPAQAPRRPPPAWERSLHRLPAGGTVLLAGVLGLALPGARRWALLGAAFFGVGPGPWLLLRAFGIRGTEQAGLLQGVLSGLPLLEALGNPTRLLCPALLLAAVAAAVALSRWPWAALVLGALALGEARLQLPRLEIPSTPVRAPAEVLAALDGPTIVFPSGDPPVWNPAVGPKEVLFLAGRAGVPVAYDYGRGRRPADLDAQVAWAAVAGTPVGEQARAIASPVEEAGWCDLPFRQVLVLEDRLTTAGRAALRGWLVGRAALVAESAEMSAWSLRCNSANSASDLNH